MKLYVCAPMTGIADANHALFGRITAELRAQGHEVISPAELDDSEDIQQEIIEDGYEAVHARLLARGIKAILCDGIEGVVVVPEWWNSGGCKAEVRAAMSKLPDGLPLFSPIGLEPVHVRFEPVILPAGKESGDV